MSLSPGTRFAGYVIQSKAKSDSLSETYLARTESGRDSVVIKVMAGAGAPDQSARMVADAMLLSAHTHSGIAQVLDAGEFDGTYFVVTEVLHGISLRRRLMSGKLAPGEACYIAVQVASAITFAHQLGVSHRNISPKNIILTNDDQVKLVNFGFPVVALIPEMRSSTSVSVEVSTRIALDSATYLSPEQVLGLEVDARTDIWGLGVTLYESLTGQVGFTGKTTAEALNGILHLSPFPLSYYLSPVPADLDQIVEKAIEKDRDRRYQAVGELLRDLNRAWRKIEVQELVDQIAVSEVTPSRYDITGGDQINVTAGSSRTDPQRSVPQPRRFSNEDEEKARRKLWFVLPALAVLLVTILALGYHKGYIRFLSAISSSRYQSINATKLTTTGRVTTATISRDGRFIAYAISAGGKQGLWVRQIDSTSLSQLVPPAELEFQALTFSNDGSSIFYVLHLKDNPVRELYQVPTQGGTGRKLVVDIDSPVTFSPDGSRIAFIRRYSDIGEDALITASTDGATETKVASRKQPDFFSTGGPSWSPDGKVIACATGTTGLSGSSMWITGVSANGSEPEKELSPSHWFRVGRITWLNDGKALLVNAVEQTLGLYQIWHVDYPGGESGRITNNLNDFRTVSASDDGSRILTIETDQLSNIWTSDGAFSSPVQITSGQYDGYYGISWTPDRRLLYSTNSSGRLDIWSMDSDGANPKQLTQNAGANVWPSASSDGKYIVFSSDRSGSLHIWRINPDGSGPKQMTFGDGEDWARFSPDGKWIIYTTIGGTNRFTLWKVSVESGQPIQLADKLSMQAAYSPDGKSLASGFRSKTNSPWKLATFAGDSPMNAKLFDLPASVPLPIVVRWRPDGKAITYIDTQGGSSNLWNLSLDGGGATQLTRFYSDQIFAFDWSPDGEKIVYSRGDAINDVVLISENH